MFHFQFSKFIREDCALSPRHYQNTGVYSDMKKKQLKEECVKENIELTGDETKDDIVVLLENKADGIN